MWHEFGYDTASDLGFKMFESPLLRYVISATLLRIAATYFLFISGENAWHLPRGLNMIFVCLRWTRNWITLKSPWIFGVGANFTVAAKSYYMRKKSPSFNIQVLCGTIINTRAL